MMTEEPLMIEFEGKPLLISKTLFRRITDIDPNVVKQISSKRFLYLSERCRANTSFGKIAKFKEIQR